MSIPSYNIINVFHFRPKSMNSHQDRILQKPILAKIVSLRMLQVDDTTEQSRDIESQI